MRAHPLPSWNIRTVQATGSPSAPRKQGGSQYHAGNFEGAEAPWALSALPECLLPQSVWRARTIAGLMVHVPPGAMRIAPGTDLRYRNCTIAVRARDAVVTRGGDRFHIPPLSQFFTSGGNLYFVRQARWAELRVYTVSNL